MNKLLTKSLVEFLGTLTLVVFGCGAVATCASFELEPAVLMIALAFGLVVHIVIYAGGHLSGAHYNPGVTIAFALFRHFPPKEVFAYLLAQFSGAFLGAALLIFIFSPLHPDLPASTITGVTQPAFEHTLWLATIECGLSMVLMFVIMAVATDCRAVGHMAGLAIGGTVALEALVAGPLTGASMNAARSFGPAIASGNYSFLWVYVITTIAGCCLGALLYRLCSCSDATNTSVKGCC